MILVKQPKDNKVTEDNIFVSPDQNTVEKPKVIDITEDLPALITARLRCPLTISVKVAAKGNLKYQYHMFRKSQPCIRMEIHWFWKDAHFTYSINEKIGD